VLKLWKFALEDLKRLGVKTFQPRFVNLFFSCRITRHALRAPAFLELFTRNAKQIAPTLLPAHLYLYSCLSVRLMKKRENRREKPVCRNNIREKEESSVIQGQSQ
jgi:hypothetical protein